MHEIAHSLGFISGVDTLSTLLPPTPFDPPGPMHATPMVTVLDLFRYSADSKVIATFVPDVSLPVPGFAAERYLSFDGGVTAVGPMSTGVGLAGDMKQAGHWKDDPTFALMDPDLDLGFELVEAFDALLAGPLPPDLMALDVIGWTIVIVPEASPFLFGGLACALAGLLSLRRRRLPRRDMA
jgi:hypothetical protein